MRHGHEIERESQSKQRFLTHSFATKQSAKNTIHYPYLKHENIGTFAPLTTLISREILAGKFKY